MTATACLAVVLVVWVLSPRLRGFYDPPPGPQHDRRLAPPEVVAWAGEVAPGVKGLLAPVWGDPGPDRFHDQQVNRRLELGEGKALAYYRLVLFNTTDEERVVRLGDGALSIRTSPPEAEVASRSLVAMESRGEVTLSPGTRAVLSGLGALHEEVKVPPGSAATLLVAFRSRVDLAEAARISARDGQDFHRRPMARAELQDLLYDPPDPVRVRDL
jgi:hypothetical protein